MENENLKQKTESLETEYEKRGWKVGKFTPDMWKQIRHKTEDVDLLDGKASPTIVKAIADQFPSITEDEVGEVLEGF